MKKGRLAELAGVRPGTISAVANSDKAPEVATLQRLADGFTKFDRLRRPDAPDVPLWEFFVSDDQSDLLRQSDTKQKLLVKQDELLDRVMSKLAPLVTAAITDELQGPKAPPQIVEPQRRKRA